MGLRRLSFEATSGSASYPMFESLGKVGCKYCKATEYLGILIPGGHMPGNACEAVGNLVCESERQGTRKQG